MTREYEGRAMGLGGSLRISATGLEAQQSGIGVIGNNLANINTTAFKGNRPEFTNLFYQTLQGGAEATSTNPGANPRQLGQGVALSGVGVDLTQGPVSLTGRREDLSIFGQGYFVLRNGESEVYTRNGIFTLDSASRLAGPQNLAVQGYGINEDFQIVTDEVVDITIPLGQLEFGSPTTTADWSGTLNAAGAISTQATIRQSAPTSAASLNDALASVMIGGTPLINDGSGSFSEPIEVTYTPRKPPLTLTPASITLAPADTLGTLMDFVTQSLEISQAVSQPPGNTPGASLGASGEITLTGNLGAVSDFEILASDFQVRRLSDNATGSLQLDLLSLVQSANGESVAAAGTAFDSEGIAVRLDVTVYLESRTTGSTSWRALFSSPDQNDGSGINRVVGNSLLTFDGSGNLISDSHPTLSIELDDRTAVNPLVFNNDFSSLHALSVPSSFLALTQQDGLRRGTLVDFGVDTDGTIRGIFDNGGTRAVGQVLLARFDNPSGLIAQAEGIFQEGLNSGPATISTPGSTVGTVSNGSLEGSNVDLADGLVELINISVAFGANSRAFATAQELLTGFVQQIR